MRARERVTRAIEFLQPDHLPLRFASDPERSDYVSLKLDPPAGWQPARPGLDEWGCYWQAHAVTSRGQVTGHPLEDWSALERYAFPDPDTPGRFASGMALAAQCKDRYLVGSVGIMGLNLLTFLRGFENLMVDLLTERESVDYLLQRILAFMKGIAAGWARVGAQAVSVADDLGTEQGTLIHPDLWREIFQPVYTDCCAYVHSLGMHAVLHSCGNVWDIIGDLIEAGFDVLNLEQPRVFGLERLGATFAGRVCFLTNPDSQTVLPSATPAEVAAETELVVRTLATEAGGIIGNADCTWNHGYVPTANLEAMAETFEALRARPWGDWPPRFGLAALGRD